MLHPLLLLLGAVLGASLGALGVLGASVPSAHHVSRRQAAPRGAEISRTCSRCICAARQCDWTTGCQGGACGGYDITEAYFNHSNLTREAQVYADRTFEACTTDPKCAITVVKLYMRTLATDCDEDGTIDCDDMMMTHYYGLEGCIGAHQWVEFTNEWKRYRDCIAKYA